MDLTKSRINQKEINLFFEKIQTSPQNALKNKNFKCNDKNIYTC